MARASLEHDVPQIAIPVGSLAEVRRLGIPTRNIATCSKRIANDNAGCSEYDRCDREHRDERPHNEIVRTIGTTGDVRVGCQACFVTVRAEINSEDKGTLVQVIGGEGETYKYRGSVKTHVKRNPDCNECAQGKCEKYHDTEDLEAVCTPFPAAVDFRDNSGYPLRKFGRRQEARREGAATRMTNKERKLLGPEDGASADA